MILAFDVRVEREAQELAESLGVKIFSADIIYHLFDAFTNHRKVITFGACNTFSMSSLALTGAEGEKSTAVSEYSRFSMSVTCPSKLRLQQQRPHCNWRRGRGRNSQDGNSFNSA